MYIYPWYICFFLSLDCKKRMNGIVAILIFLSPLVASQQVGKLSLVKSVYSSWSVMVYAIHICVTILVSTTITVRYSVLQ